jgi:hypothetical protein
MGTRVLNGRLVGNTHTVTVVSSPSFSATVGNIGTNGSLQVNPWFPGARPNGLDRAGVPDRAFPCVPCPESRARKLLLMSLGARDDAFHQYPITSVGTDVSLLQRVEWGSYETVICGVDGDPATITLQNVRDAWADGSLQLLADGLPSWGSMQVPLDVDVPPSVSALVCLTLGRLRLLTGVIGDGLGDTMPDGTYEIAYWSAPVALTLGF